MGPGNHADVIKEPYAPLWAEKLAFGSALRNIHNYKKDN